MEIKAHRTSSASVPTNAPPLFLLCAADDEMASSTNLSLYISGKLQTDP
jgi:hypothetical protein